MTTRARSARVALGAACFLALIGGTVWGDDDNFPLGPFRMYSVKNELDGEVRAVEIQGTTRSGRVITIPYADFGLRRADIQGQLGKLEEPPRKVLAALHRALVRLDPTPPQFTELRLRERTYDLEDGRPVGESVETQATWRVP